MQDIERAKERFLDIVTGLQEKKELAATVGPDYYEPGNMENLDQYLGQYDRDSDTVTIRTEAKGLRYDERTRRLDYLVVGDSVIIEREPNNQFNSNNLAILSEGRESLGNLPAEICNAIAPLLDRGYIVIENSFVSYLERIKDRSRYARQGVLFVEIRIHLQGI